MTSSSQDVPAASFQGVEPTSPSSGSPLGEAPLATSDAEQSEAPTDVGVAVLTDAAAALAIGEPLEVHVHVHVDAFAALSHPIEGSIFEVSPYRIKNLAGIENIMDSRLEEITIVMATNRQWIALKSSSTMAFEEIVAKLFQNKILGGVARQADGGFFILLKKRRFMTSCFTFLEDSKLYGFTVLPGVSKESKSFAVKMFKDFLKSGREVFTNYVLEPSVASLSTASSSAVDAAIEVVSKRVKTMDHDEFEKEIMRSRMAPRDGRTLEQSLVVSCAPNLKLLRKTHEESLQAFSLMKRLSDNEKLIGFAQFEALQNLELWGVDFDTWSVFRITVGDFLKKGLFIKFSVVLLGPPRTGKTPAAESMAALMANALQYDELDEMKTCYYLKVGTVESLKKVGSQLVAGVPLVFDDITPSEKRGTRASMSWNELKHLTYITKGSEGSEALDARNDDITLPPDCPRVFTSNALTPCDWMSGMVDVSTLSPSGVEAALHNNSENVESAAIYKRCVFAYVPECLIPREKRRVYEGDCINSAASKIARFM